VIVAPRAVTLFVRATALHRSLPAPGHDRVNAERLRHRRGGCRDAVPAQRLPEPGLALSAVGTDAGFACPALKLDKLASTFVPTFAYEFNDDNAPQRYLPPVSFPYGAAHASEIQYLFDLPTAPIAGTLTEQQETLATSMRRYWAHFAARGWPSSADQPWWPRFNRHSQKMLSLAPPQPQVQTGFAAEHRCAFWDQTR
jgi:para-nitrobenzyl esterase